jgi:hypothetical protein
VENCIRAAVFNDTVRDASAVVVDTNNGRIVRVRPLQYD